MKIPFKKTTIIALLMAAAAIGGAASSGGFERAGSKRPTVSVAVNDAPLERQTKLATSFAPVVKKVAPGVVNVFTTKTVKSQIPEITPFFDDPFFRRFFGQPFGDNGGRRGPRTVKGGRLGPGGGGNTEGCNLANKHARGGAARKQRGGREK